MPVIGIPLRYEHLKDGRCILYLPEKVRRCIQCAGGEVFTITPVQDIDYMDTKMSEFPELTGKEKELINKNLDKCDGVLIPGGVKNTMYDMYILDYCIKNKIPTLGICLGMQLMSCYKEDYWVEKNETDINHKQEHDEELTHTVSIDENSKLYKILGKTEIKVNSFHNYHALKNHIYKTVATSPDGIIEAIEYPGVVFNIGLQWHPEISYNFDENSRKIIDSLINEAERFSEEKLEKELV